MRAFSDEGFFFPSAGGGSTLTVSGLVSPFGPASRTNSC